MDEQRWHSMSLARQVGNIGSEISRARHWEEKGDKTSRDRALERALHYLDLTTKQDMPLTRRRELLRFREVVGAWHQGQGQEKGMENYCAVFAMEARQGK